MNGLDPSGQGSLLLVLSTIALVGVVVLVTSHLPLKPAQADYRDRVLRVKVCPVLIARSDVPDLIVNGAKDYFQKELARASGFWKKWAGIEFYSDEVLVVRNDEVNLKVVPGSIEAAVGKYYSGSPVILIVDSLDTPDTAGLVAMGSKNGFAVVAGISSARTIAHEMGHILIPRMYSHGFYATHVGNVSNLMSSGEAASRAGVELGDMFLTSAQAEEARKTIVKKGWAR